MKCWTFLLTSFPLILAVFVCISCLSLSLFVLAVFVCICCLCLSLFVLAVFVCICCLCLYLFVLAVFVCICCLCLSLYVNEMLNLSPDLLPPWLIQQTPFIQLFHQSATHFLNQKLFLAMTHAFKVQLVHYSIQSSLRVCLCCLCLFLSVFVFLCLS